MPESTVGMTVVVPSAAADEALRVLHENGEPEAYVLGEIIKDDENKIILE